MNGSHNEFAQLSKNKPTREHNVTLHHSLPITLRYIKERRKTMRSEAASSRRATSNPQSTIRSSFHVHFISENHRQPHGQKMAAPLLTAPICDLHSIPSVKEEEKSTCTFILERGMTLSFLSLIQTGSSGSCRKTQKTRRRVLSPLSFGSFCTI